IPVELEIDFPTRLEPKQEAALYFTVSEALANVVKYASADVITIRAVADERQAVIEIRDDGVGGAHPARRRGPRAPAARVEAAGGRCPARRAAARRSSPRPRASAGRPKRCHGSCGSPWPPHPTGPAEARETRADRAT